MSEAKKTNALPLVTSLANHSIIITDSQGGMKRAYPRYVPMAAYSIDGDYILDLNEATSPGLWLLDSSRSPLNGPAGIDLAVGILEVFTRYTFVIVQRVTSRFGDMAIRSYWSSSNSWSSWNVMKNQ